MIPTLHVITDDEVVGTGAFLGRAGEVLREGGGELALHLRAHALGGRRMYELAVALVPVARAAGARLLVNDRLDVALAAGADGAHLGRRGLTVADGRTLLGAERLLGASVHSAAEAKEAVPGADFLLVGTLYASASHPRRAGAGVGVLRELARFRRPMIGIGGVTVDRVAEVREAGAAGIAVIGAVWLADDPGSAVRTLLDAWHGTR